MRWIDSNANRELGILWVIEKWKPNVAVNSYYLFGCWENVGKLKELFELNSALHCIVYFWNLEISVVCHWNDLNFLVKLFILLHFCYDLKAMERKKLWNFATCIACNPEKMTYAFSYSVISRKLEILDSAVKVACVICSHGCPWWIRGISFCIAFFLFDNFWMLP